MNYVPLAGRVLLGLLFLLAGINKITGYAGTQGFMESNGVPGILLPLVILVEVGGGLALIVGWQTRWAALGLAVFSVLTAAIFHLDMADPNLLKNLAVAGGMLLLYVHGAGPMSLDNRQAA